MSLAIEQPWAAAISLTAVQKALSRVTLVLCPLSLTLLLVTRDFPRGGLMLSLILQPLAVHERGQISTFCSSPANDETAISVISVM
jgi:hypothetical protein